MDPRDPSFDKVNKHLQRQFLAADEALKRGQRAAANVRVPSVRPPKLTLPRIPLGNPAPLTGFVAQTDRLVKDVRRRVATLLRSAFRPPDLRLPVIPNLDVGRLVGSIPKIVNFGAISESFRELMEAVREGDLALEEAEFGFADQLWDIGTLLDLAGIDPRVRPAVVTRRLSVLAGKEEFEQALCDPFSSSRLLGKRWPVVEEALWAHRNRRYLLSVPPLLTQVEGAIADAMVLKNLVVVRNGQPYLAGADGEPRLDKKGKPLAPVTLGKAVREARLEEHEALEVASVFVADSLVRKRNAILHGRDLAYGTARPSTQLLLLLLVLARLVEELEHGPNPQDGTLLN